MTECVCQSVSVKIPEGRFFKVMISSNADGASLNFRMNRANLAQLEKSRPRLITIHATKLSLTNSLPKIKEYKDIDDIMTSIFHVFLQKVENTTAALNIGGYIFPEVTGTIFVTHRLKGT